MHVINPVILTNFFSYFSTWVTLSFFRSMETTYFAFWWFFIAVGSKVFMFVGACALTRILFDNDDGGCDDDDDKKYHAVQKNINETTLWHRVCALFKLFATTSYGSQKRKPQIYNSNPLSSFSSNFLHCLIL